MVWHCSVEQVYRQFVAANARNVAGQDAFLE